MSNSFKPIVHDANQKLWCGPASIAAVTGFNTAPIYDLFKELRGRGGITGVHDDEMLRVMHRLGFDLYRHTEGEGQTVEQVVTTLKHPCIIGIDRHFLSGCAGHVVDNHNPKPTRVERSALRREPVLDWYQFVKSTRAPELAELHTTPRERMNRARRLGALYGVDIEKDGDMWWVTCDTHFTEANDPLGEDHLAYNAEQVLNLVEIYVKHLKK